MLLASFNAGPRDTTEAFLFYLLIVAIPAYLALTYAAAALRIDRPRWLLGLGIFCLALPLLLWAVRVEVRTVSLISSLTLLMVFEPMQMSPALLLVTAAVALWAVGLGAFCIGEGLKARGLRSRAPATLVLVLGLATVVAVLVLQNREGGITRGWPTFSTARAETVEGLWQIEANGYRGHFELHSNAGAWTGRSWFDAQGRWEPLIGISVDGDRLAFLRPEASQPYRGVVTRSVIAGTFVGQGGTYSWRAWRGEPPR